MKRRKGRQSMQGEGDYEAARRYRREAQSFARDLDAVRKAARDAEPRNASEACSLLEAERKGRSRARGR